MIKIYIQSIEDGLHDIDMSIPVEEVVELYPEYFGNIHLVGKLRKFGKRYTFTGSANCKAALVCDMSLKNFTKEISANLNVSYLADTFLFQMSSHSVTNKKSESDEIIIAEEDKYIDLTSEIREELAVSMPMKRVAPEYEGKNFEDIYPQYSPNSQTKKKKVKKGEIDDRWAPLKKIKLN
ncbi:MAG: hypothetical protein A2X61_12615 [Ignavibacteria bacterium GWB2_35_12]|nr:MAG: hypothetical protein A2X63_07655 [Ignavibacteria bacterium GWA2_35_8]OGU41627.1 MAG: hypothetical protein A2X61_12615 [Ignavibacteria bacterium GWB2_35_12]OGU91367.1 MAG: hypothetical protein A2220_08430 [Ignavibacteria bacterium RIFOXYA2_FULL_35_10]OGV24961.1 MAG: hypothetical protein A2475_16460 [Ignavibacteria bacterium RIFOXYC2_FULL_35_21]